MARKVIREEVQVPTDKWSGLHLSKSVDFTALTKNDVSCFFKYSTFLFDKLVYSLIFCMVVDVSGIIVRLYPRDYEKYTLLQWE